MVNRDGMGPAVAPRAMPCSPDKERAGFIVTFTVYPVNIFSRPQTCFWVFFRYTVIMALKKRRGRPPKSSGDAKSEGILLRLESREKKGFQDAANVAGVPLAVWMRERLRKAAIRDLEEVGKPIAFLLNEG
jgi:hypothetical protein